MAFLANRLCGEEKIRNNTCTVLDKIRPSTFHLAKGCK